MLTFVVLFAFAYNLCYWGSGGGRDDDDDGDNGINNEATSLGAYLALISGQIEWQFDISDQTCTDLGSGTATDDDFEVTGEDNGAVYFTDDNTNLSMATVVINVSGATYEEMAYCELVSGTPDVLQQYFYLYATGEVVLDGTFVDTDETPNENHTFNNIRFFEGWNQVIKETSDGVTYDYVTGTLSDGNWCYMDNP